MYGKGQLRQKSVYIYLFNLHVHAIEHKENAKLPKYHKEQRYIHHSSHIICIYIFINAVIQKSLQFTENSALWGNPDSNPNSKSSILD